MKKRMGLVMSELMDSTFVRVTGAPVLFAASDFLSGKCGENGRDA